MNEYRTRQVARFRRGIAVLLAVCLMLSMMAGCSLFRSRIPGPEPDVTYVEPEPGEHSVPSIWPLGSEWQEISSSFGVRRGRSRSHKGIDILAPKGTPVMAAADGEVIFSGNSGRYGKMVVLQHAGGRQTAYAHLDVCLAPVGRRVRQGDVIGRVGRTGNASTTHLHYEVREQGRPVNPMKFLPER